MSLSLQPAVTSTSLNGLPAQSIEGASSQPLSFEEVLKVEEKKLQQEINTQSAAALLATIQQPAMPDSIHGLDAGNLAESASSVDQAALTTDSVQPAATQPRQSLQLHDQQITLPEKAAAKIQTNFSMPVPEVEETDQHQPGKTQPAPQLKEAKTAVNGEAQNQIAQPVGENRSHATTSVSTTQAASTPANDAEKTGVKISVRKDDSSSTPAQPSETKSAPEVTRTVEKVRKPSLSQTDLSVASTNAAITQPFTSNVTIQSESMPLANKTRKVFVADAKSVELDQENAPAFETPQPAAKTQSENPPVSLKREVETGSHTPKASNTSSSQNETSLPERAETLQRDRVASETTQMKATVTEIPQPVSKKNIRAAKSISSDGVEESQNKPVSANNEAEPGDHFKNAILSKGSSPFAAKTQQAFPQNDSAMPEVSFAAKGSETAQPVETPEAPISIVSHSNKVDLASIEDNEINVQQKPFVEDMKSTLSTDAYVPAEKTAATIKSDKQVSAAVKMDIPVQVNIPESEIPQPVQVTVAPNVKLNSPTISDEPATTETTIAVPVQANPFVSEISRSAKVKMTVPVQADALETEMSQPVKESIAPAIKSAAPEINNEPEIENITTGDMSQPVKETVVRNATSTSVEINNEHGKTEIKNSSRTQIEVLESENLQPTNETITPKAKVVQFAQMEIPVHEVSQPVKETVAPSAKSVTTEPVQSEVLASEISQPVEETVVPSAKSVTTAPAATKMKVTEPVQSEVLASEISQPVKETIAPSAKSVTTEPLQPEVLASEISQPVKETVAPSMKPVTTEPAATKMKIAAQSEILASELSQPMTETSQPATSQVPAVEMEETILKSKAPALEFDNATAENLLKVGSRPQIKNEAFVVEQKNAPVEIKPERVLQSARVEIESDEKVTAKEPALDMESNVVIAGTDKGIADVNVVKKSSVAQVDPLAREVIEQITSQVKARIKSGETSIHMKLNLEKLGEIEVQMTRTVQGVSVSFITEQASTGQLIESQVNQLRQSLKDAGVQLVNLNISQHGQSYQEGGGFKQSQQFVQTSRRDVPLVEDAGTQPQHVGLTSEIDYLV